MYSNLLLNSLRQFRKNESIAHAAEIEDEALGKTGVQVDRDPRVPVGIVAREHRNGMFGAQLEDAVGVAREREQLTSCVGLLGVGFGHDSQANCLPPTQ